ncbi:MAG: hypothetical protein A2104_05800 [Candidatus Melainabacteria bacterium GWF2_32_7]|nr:MAG: hypothetical protein A2104_05800 [Candidatus Melainabacteria bacterium GWF2_32_7]
MRKLFLIITLLIVISKAICPALAENVIVQANKQNYNAANNLMTFEGNVKVDFDNISIKSPKAFLKTGQDGKPQAATFVQGAEAIKIDRNSKSSVKANIIKVSILENKIRAQGNPSSTITENKKPIATIKSDEQEFDMESNIITATGNVTINYEEIKANSTNAKIKINESGKPELINLIGSARVTQGKNIVNATNLLFNPISNELIASGSAKSQTILEDMTQVSIWSDYQQFDQNTHTLITSGRVKIVYKDYIATGPKATFLPDTKTNKPNKIVFMGRSKIQEGSRTVEADKLELSVNPKTFTAEGNVRSQFTQIGLNNKLNSSTKKQPKTTEETNKEEKINLDDFTPVNDIK